MDTAFNMLKWYVSVTIPLGYIAIHVHDYYYPVNAPIVNITGSKCVDNIIRGTICGLMSPLLIGSYLYDYINY